MLFSLTFEIGFLIIGFLYVGHLYFSDVIDLINVGREVEKEEKEKKHDEELSTLSKHLYS